MNKNFVKLGIDLGGTKIEIAALDTNENKIIYRYRLGYRYGYRYRYRYYFFSFSYMSSVSITNLSWKF